MEIEAFRGVLGITPASWLSEWMANWILVLYFFNPSYKWLDIKTCAHLMGTFYNLRFAYEISMN